MNIFKVVYRLFRLRLFSVDEQRNMPNKNALYITNPLFLFFTISAFGFCFSFLGSF